MKNRSFEVLCHKKIRNARSKRCPDRVSGQDGGESQWSGQHIRIGNTLVRVRYSREPCASPWGSSDRRARHMSSLGIRMELIRIALRAPCHLEEGSLHLAHADGPPWYIAPSIRGHPDGVDPNSLAARISHNWMEKEDVPSADISHPDISQSDGRGGRFNFSDQTYLDPLIAFTRRVFLLVYSAAVFSWSFLVFLTDILRYFRPTSWEIFYQHREIFCFRYLLCKSPKSPCSPPIIGFLSL